MNRKKNNKLIIYTGLLILVTILFVSPYMMCAAGQNFLKNNKPVDAYKILSKAHKLRPNNRDIRYYYVKAMSQLKPVEQIQKEMFKFSEDKTDDAARKLARQQVDNWRNNLLANIGSNYIEQAPYDRNLLRWDVNTFPLKVKIEAPISVPDYYKAEIEKAFMQWTASADFLSFTFVEDGNADIYVEFSPLPEDICEDGICKYVVAYTVPKISGKHLKSMTITMYDKDANGNYFSDKEIYNTTLHEIGHALGIMGHSYSSDDLMYMSSTPETTYTRYRSAFHYLSTDDINTIVLLYKMIPDITNVSLSKFNKEGLIYSPIVLGNARQISSRKIREAENYIESAPDIPNGYIDLAVAYADQENYTKAIEALRAALERAQTDSDRYLIYYNIAAAHLNSNNLDEAEQYLELARKINDNDEIAELQSNINHARASKKKPFKATIDR